MELTTNHVEKEEIMKREATKHIIIPCNNNVEVLIPYRDAETKEICWDNSPVIAWKIVYDETELDENNAYAVPVCESIIDSLFESLLFYPEKNMWRRGGLESGTLETLYKECEEIVKKREERKEKQTRRDDYDTRNRNI